MPDTTTTTTTTAAGTGGAGVLTSDGREKVKVAADLDVMTARLHQQQRK